MAVKTAVELELLNAQYLRKLKETRSRTETSFKGLSSVVKGFGVALAGAVIARGFKAVLAATERQMQAEAQLEARLKSTGHAAGMSAEEIKKMASSLQQVTTYGDEAILEGQNLLLTFTKIGKDVFPDATETMLDMSTALGQDLKQSAIQLGKALNDPIQGVTALRRVGVQLSKEQEAQIRHFMSVNDVASAQRVILGELSNQMGGAAAAAASTFGGRMQQIANALGDAGESVGKALVPGLQDLASSLMKAGTGEGSSVFIAAMTDVATVVSNTATAISRLINWINELDAKSNKVGNALKTIANNLPVGLMYRYTKSVMSLAAGKEELATKTNETIPPLQNVGAVIDQNSEKHSSATEQFKIKEQEKTDFIKEQEDLRLESFLQHSMSVLGVAQNLTSQMAALEQQRTANSVQSMTNRYTWAKRYIEATVSDEDEKQKKLEQLAKIEELHKKIMARREAQRMKQFRVAEATMSMFAGAVNSYQAMAGIPYVGPILGAIAAAAALALGAANISMIQSTPIPALAKGTPEIPTDTLMQAHRGEMVVPSSFADAIRSGDLTLGGGGDGGSRVIQLVVDGRKLAEVVDDNRSRRASSLGASNYAYGSVYK